MRKKRLLAITTLVPFVALAACGKEASNDEEEAARRAPLKMELSVAELSEGGCLNLSKTT